MNSSVLSGKPALLIATLDAGKIAGEWHKKMHIDVGDQFSCMGAIQYWECQDTGLRFYTPAEAAGSGNLYSQLEKYEWYYVGDKWEFREALGMLPKASAILEVGVGEGHFLQAAKQNGHICYGVELNTKAAARVRDLGFEVFEQSLNDLVIHCQKRFDVICSFQVLEHIARPLDFLQSMIALLNPGGRLIISVPNASVMKNIDPHNQDLLNQPPHHMSHWDANVFRSLVKLLPVEIKAIRCEPLARYHVAWMVNGFLRNKLSFAGQSLSRFLINRYTTLPLQLMLQAGLRNFLPGHTLLIELKCLPVI